MSPPLVPPGYLDAVAVGAGVGGALLGWLVVDSMPSAAPFGDLDTELAPLLAVLMAASTVTSVYTFPLIATVYVVLGGVVFVLVMAFVLLFTTDLLLMS